MEERKQHGQRGCEKADTNMLGPVLTEMSHSLQDNGLKSRPLMFAKPAHKLIAIGRREFTQFPRLPFEQVRHSNLSVQIMCEDIGALLRRNLNSKDIYELLGVIRCPSLCLCCCGESIP